MENGLRHIQLVEREECQQSYNSMILFPNCVVAEMMEKEEDKMEEVDMVKEMEMVGPAGGLKVEAQKEEDKMAKVEECVAMVRLVMAASVMVGVVEDYLLNTVL